MFRYIGLIWNAEDGNQSDEARRIREEILDKLTEMSEVLACTGASVFCEPESDSFKIYRFPNVNGVLFGTLFRVDSAGVSTYCVRDLGQDAAQLIEASEGRALVSRYWGRYVAFLEDAAAGAMRVLRDPSGGIQCMYTEKHGIGIYFSDVAACCRIGLSFSIDWDFVAGQITTWTLEGERTMLVEATNVGRGMCISARHGRRTAMSYWNAGELAASNMIDDEQEAAFELRHAVVDSIRAWASVHKRIVAYLSGGVDSSILIGCLEKDRSDQAVTCLTYFAQGPDGDEREHARRSATFAGLPLIERPYEWRVDLSAMLNGGFSTTLRFNPVRIANSRKEAALAAELGAKAMYSGGGGDQVFGASCGVWAAEDFARAHWINRRSLSISLDSARLGRCSVYRIFGRALKHGIFAYPGNPLDDTRSNPLATERARRMAVDARSQHHDWWRFRRILPRGTLAHIMYMSERSDMDDPLSMKGDPDLIEPLMTQRVQATSARIPTYLLMSDGWDRGLARKAFKPFLHPETARRRSKGAVGLDTLAMVRYNEKFIRSVLFGGVLEQQGLIDRGLLDAFLSGNPTSPAADVDVFQVLAAECRLRAWQ